MKLNLGCGNNRLEGYCNVDAYAGCAPDQVVDLERFPWPFADGVAEEIRLCHVLEHLGQDPQVFLGVMKELYRVSRPDARIHIDVPHPLHRDFHTDPTHVRVVTPETLEMFSLPNCLLWQSGGYANTPLALMCDVDFELERTEYMADPETFARLTGLGLALSEADLVPCNSLFPDLIRQIRMTLRVCKPPRG
jgi:hypothetical protein